MLDDSVHLLPVVPFFPTLLLIAVLELSLHAPTLSSGDWLTTTDVRHEQDRA
jgi:hypothetical protein